jgi:hypothetical protein
MSQLTPMTCPVNEDLMWAVLPEDDAGNIVHEMVTFASSDSAVFEVQPEADGLSARFVSKGAVGSVAVLSVMDANGVSDSVEVTIGAAPVTHFVSNLSFVPKS